MKRIVFLLLILCINGLIFSQNRTIDIQVDKNKYIRIEPCSPTIFRIRMNQTGNFSESIMERYGIIKKDWKPVEYKTETTGGIIKITTNTFSISIDKKNGSLTWKDKTSTFPLHSIHFSVNDTRNKSINFTKSRSLLLKYLEKISFKMLSICLNAVLLTSALGFLKRVLA